MGLVLLNPVVGLAANPFMAQTGVDAGVYFDQKTKRVNVNVNQVDLQRLLTRLAAIGGVNCMFKSIKPINVSLHIDQKKWLSVFDNLVDIYDLSVVKKSEWWLVSGRSGVAQRSVILPIHHQSAELVAKQLTVWLAKTYPNAKVIDGHMANALMVIASPKALVDIKHWLAYLDKPRQQVVIQAEIMTVDTQSLNQLGVHLYQAAEGGGAASVMGQFDVNLKRLVDSRQLMARLIGLINQGDGQIIAKPQLTTSDGHTAHISTGTDVPYQQAANNGATSIAFKKALLRLEVTPFVQSKNQILLKLKINQDGVGSELTNGVPTIQTRELESQIRVKDGETVVLGGIFEDHDQVSVHRLPLLSDIPLLGHLFQYRSTHQQKRELLVFVTPKLVVS